MSLLKKIALAISRTPEESLRIESPAANYAKYALFGVAFLGFATLLLPIIGGRQVAAFREGRPNVVIPADAWRVQYRASAGPCSYDARGDRRCPANPANASLWQSEFHRADKGHFERVKQRRGGEFWIGATVRRDILEVARRERANHLIIGWITATYRIWIDGEFALEGTRSDSTPVVLNLPMKRLSQDKPLHIAVQIYHDAESPFPDFCNSGLGNEGFATGPRAGAYRNSVAFDLKARPMALVMANLLIAGLFFVFWLSSKTKQEYFYIALFALVSAGLQVRRIDYFFRTVDLGTVYSVTMVFRFLEAFFLMFLGLAFARAKPVFFRIGLPVGVALPIALAAAQPDTIAQFYLDGLVGKWAVPAMQAIGVAACYLQAAYLFTKGRTGTHLPVRVRRLLLFGTGLLGLALLHAKIGPTLTSPTAHVAIQHFGHFGLVVYLCYIALGDYRERELLLEKTPVSEYHRRPVLPAKLSGAVLVADLKDSETFFRYRARHGESDNAVSLWRSHFYTSILKNGGTVLYKKGDELLGFYDREKCDNPVAAALRTVEDMETMSPFLEEEFRARQLFPPDARSLRFRAAVTTGQIRPVWEKFGANREAYWEEAGSTSPFVESSRLLDLEKQISGGDSNVTLVVIPERLVTTELSDRPDARERLVARDTPLRDKHGSEHRVAVYKPFPVARVIPLGRPGDERKRA